MATIWRCATCALSCLFLIAAVACSGGHAARTTPSDSATTAATAPSESNTAQPAATTPRGSAQPHMVAISAGHGGPHNVGAVHKDAQGNADLVEKDLTLDVARRLNAVLQQRGYRTVMIRDGDYSLSSN